MIRRWGVTDVGVTDVPWFLDFEIKCLISIQHFTVVIMVQPYHNLGC